MPFVNNYSPVQSFKDKEMCITVTTKKKKKSGILALTKCLTLKC